MTKYKNSILFAALTVPILTVATICFLKIRQVILTNTSNEKNATSAQNLLVFLFLMAMAITLVYALYIIIEINKRQKTEKELFRYKDELEKKMISKTEELLESEKKYKYTLDKMIEGVQIIDPDFRYVYVNEVVAAHGKSTPEELIGYTMMEKYPGIENSEVFAAIKKCMHERKPQHLENEFVFPDKTKGWFELSIQPVKEGIFILSNDITDRKKAQKEIESLNEKLEEKIEERTAQLQTVNKELETFSYSVSHDLRAPLRALHGYSKMIEEDYDSVLDDEAKRLLGNIQYYSQKMGKLIDDMLAFSRMGRKEILKAEIDMNELVKSVLNELMISMPHKAKIKIHPLPSIEADLTLIHLVWMNLISNAIKYSSKKETPEIIIGSENGKNEMIYYVKDNGAGFDMKYSHRLFGVFQRLHAPEDFEGTGIGLATTQRILIKHDGKIWFDAQHEKGANFYFTLPVSKIQTSKI
jgi:PAS domain S-box-containing protein